MQLSELRSALRNRLGVPSTDGMFTDAVCTELVNAAIQKINGDHDWGWLEKSESINTANGTEAYSVGADWLRTVLVQYGDYPPLQRVAIDDIRTIGTPAGRPQSYAVFAEQLHLRPVPTSVVALTHLYIKQETALSGDSDAPAMPLPYQWVIVEYAAYLGFRRIGKLDEAGGAKAAYDDWLSRWLADEKRSRYSADMGGGADPTPPAATK